MKQVLYRLDKLIGSDYFEKYIRAGLMIRGVLYMVVGWLAFKFALGWSSGVVDISGALVSIYSQPWGGYVSWVFVIGLMAYSLWGWIRVFYNPFGKSKGWNGVALRGGYLISAVSYLTVSLFAIQLNLQMNSRHGTKLVNDPMFYLLNQSWGVMIFRVIGVIMIGAAVMRLISGLKRSFVREIDINTLAVWTRRLIVMTGVVGSIVRSIVYGVIGYFFWDAQARLQGLDSAGVDEALYFIYQVPYGKWILLVISLGFGLFGLYSLLVGWRLRYTLVTNEEQLVDE